MRKVLAVFLFLLGMFGAERASAQTFTFECVCDYVVPPDCDICNTQVQSRLLNGLLIRRSGTAFKWIEYPYLVRIQGNNAVIQELIFPNPETVTINLSGTGFATMAEYMDSLQCNCGGGGGGVTYIAGPGIVISGDTISAVDTSATNEIQQIDTFAIFSGNQLCISLSADGVVKHCITLPSGSADTTIVTAGTGILVTGDGSLGSPYVITNTGDLSNTNEIQRLDTFTIVSGVLRASLLNDGVPFSSVTLPTADGSETQVNAGTAIGISGTGTTGSPYVVTNTADLSVTAGGTNALQIALNTSGQTPIFVKGMGQVTVTESATGDTVKIGGVGGIYGVSDTTQPAHVLTIAAASTLTFQSQGDNFGGVVPFRVKSDGNEPDIQGWYANGDSLILSRSDTEFVLSTPSGLTVASGANLSLSGDSVTIATVGAALSTEKTYLQITSGNVVKYTEGIPLSHLNQSGATTGQVVKWNGTAWVPDDPAGGGSSDSTWVKADGTFGSDTLDNVRRTGKISIGTTDTTRTLDTKHGTIRGSIQDRGGAVYNVAAYDIFPGADESADFLSLLDTVRIRGGGVVQFNAGTYIFSSKILVPSTPQNQTRNGQIVHRNADMIWQGAGAFSSGYANPDTMKPKGTVIRLGYSGDSLGRIDTRGLGRLMINGITFQSITANSTPFFKTSNTTLDVSNCAFLGAQSGGGGEVVFQLGSNGTSTEYWSNGPVESFQGYGSVFRDNYFNQIETGFYLKDNANGIVIQGNTFWWNCGGYAAIRVEPTSSVNGGNSIRDNLIEMAGYEYGIVLGKTAANTVAANNFFDYGGAAEALIYRKNFPYVNRIDIGFFAGGAARQLKDESSNGSMQYSAMLASDTSLYCSTTKFFKPVYLNQDSFHIADTGGNGGFWWEKAAGQNTITQGVKLTGAASLPISRLTKNVSGSVIQDWEVNGQDIRVQADGIMYYAAKEYAILNDSIFPHNSSANILKNAALIVSSEAATPGDVTGYGTGIEFRPLFNRAGFGSIGARYETSNSSDNMAIDIHQKSGGSLVKRAEFGSAGSTFYSTASTEAPLTISSTASAPKMFALSASPNSAVTGNPGDMALSNTSGAGQLWLKTSGTSTTGWEQLLTPSTGLSGSGTANYVPKYTAASTMGNSLLYENGTNLGLNTTSPHAPFSIRGSSMGIYTTSGTAGGAIYLGDANYYSSGFYDKAPGIAGVFNSAVGVASDLGLYAYDGGSAQALVAIAKSNGRFGINEPTPSERLHVSGNARITGAIYDSNNDPGSSAQVLSSTVTGTDWVTMDTNPSDDITGSGTANYVPKFTSAQVLGNSLLFDNGTNVGIGTASPSQKLHVNGNAILGYALLSQDLFFGEMTMGNKDLSSFLTNYAFTQNNSGNTVFNGADLYFRTGNTTRAYMASGGNFGINETSPSERLHVSGNIRADGTIKTRGTGTAPTVYLDNTTASTGKEWYINSGNAGSLFIGNPTTADAITVNGTTGATTIANTLTVSTATGTATTITGRTSAGVITEVPLSGLTLTGGTLTATGGGTNYQTFKDDGVSLTQRPNADFISTATVTTALVDNGSNATEVSFNVPTDGITATQIAANAVGASELSSLGTAGTYGSATQVPVFTTDADGRVSAVTNTAITGLLSGLTATRIPFASAANALADDALLTWDNTTKRLSVGNTGGSPAASVHIAEGSVTSWEPLKAVGTVSGNMITTLGNANNAGGNNLVDLSVGGSSAGDPAYRWLISGVDTWSMGIDNSDADKMKWKKATTPSTLSNVGITMTADATPLIGINNDAPLHPLHVIGRATATLHQAISGSASHTFGTGAGTSPTLGTLTGTSNGLDLQFTTGTTPSANANVISITLPTAFSNTMFPVFCAANAQTATDISKFYISAVSASAFTLTANGTLSASTTYRLKFNISGR